jgi:hypothetical protein
MQPHSTPELPAPAPVRKRGAWIGFIFNAYLLCFLADSLLALASPVLGDVPHTLAGSAAMLLALLVFLIIGSYRNLPWKPLWIPLLFSLWEGCLFLPLPAFVDIKPLLFATAAAKSLISIGTFLHLRKSSGGESVIFREQQWAEAQFSLARTFGATAIQLLVLLPALMGYLVWSGQLMVRKISRGFIQIDATGLYTEARDYEKNGKVIHLLPTVHIATPAFYDTLMASLPESDLVVLPEGVTDRKNLMKAHLDYSVAADSVGLQTQPNLAGKRKEPALKPCDADVSDFSPSTLAVLNGVAGALQSAASGDTLGALQSLSTLDDKNTATIIEDIIETRNAKVVAGIQQVIQQYGHIVVPWGAAHMPGIEREILKMDFRKTESRRVQVFGWKDLKFPSEQ